MTALPDSPERVDGDGLVLRSFRDGDVTALVAAFADPEIVRWNPGPSADDDDLAWVREWMGRRNDWTPGDHVSWAVADADGALVGSVSLHQVDWDQRDAEIGYWVAPTARGRGVATLAVRIAADYAFHRLDLHRVYLFHASENVASCRVAERAGFSLEGTLRGSHRYADGRYHDEHVHGRLHDDSPP